MADISKIKLPDGTTYNLALPFPRVAKDSHYLPGKNKIVFEEYSKGAAYNLPSDAWYHIYTAEGSDENYATQLALGMTVTGAYYRRYQSGTWTAWGSLINTNTTYTFANGTNGFTVTPSGGTAQTVTVTPSITNNVTGSGTNGYLAKFNGAHTITNGVALGSSTTTFLRNDGTWATPSAGTDTKNTAGSTNNTGKLFLVGALEQSANPQTYSNSNCYIDSSTLYSRGYRVRVNNVNVAEMGRANDAGALLVNDSTGGYSVWMRGDNGQISSKSQNVVENVDNAWKRRVCHEVDTTDHSGIITHFGKTTWYQGDNVPKVTINADYDAGITVSQSNGAPAVTMYGSDISSSLLMFSRENDDPSSTLHNTIYLNASGASGTILAFGDNGNSYAGLIGDEAKVVCDKMSWTNETVTFSKSSGSWTFRDGEYTRSGNVVQIRISFKGGGSNVSVGSNAIAGTINGIPTPPYTVRLQGYYSGTVLMGELTTSGGFNVRILGQALNLSSSNAATLSGTYIVED